MILLYDTIISKKINKILVRFKFILYFRGNIFPGICEVSTDCAQTVELKPLLGSTEQDQIFALVVFTTNVLPQSLRHTWTALRRRCVLARAIGAFSSRASTTPSKPGLWSSSLCPMASGARTQPPKSLNWKSRYVSLPPKSKNLALFPSQSSKIPPKIHCLMQLCFFFSFVICT